MDPLAQSRGHGLSAADFVAAIGGTIEGDPHCRVQRFAPLAVAVEGEASFLAHPRFQPQLASSQASLLVVREQDAPPKNTFRAVILTQDPYLYFAQASALLLSRHRRAEVNETVVQPGAQVSSAASLGSRVRVGAGSVIEAGAQIGDDSDIGALCHIGEGVRIGAAAMIHARVSISAGVVIGDRAVIQSGAVIGSEGFGFAVTPDQTWVKIPQLCGVVIGDDVEVGANTVIDAGTLTPTRIGNGVKLDNLIQVAHNVEIGDHTAIAGCVGIAGSAKIGRHCQIGGAAGILGHLEIADGTIIGPMSLVMSSILTPGKYVGVMPLQPHRDWQRSAAQIRRLARQRTTPENNRRLGDDDHP